MSERFKSLVLRIFKVPPEPAPPLGSRDSVRIFRAARNYYRYALLRWGLKQVGALAGILVFLSVGTAWIGDRVSFGGKLPDAVESRLQKFGILENDGGKARIGSGAEKLLFAGEIFGLTILVVQIPFTFMLVRLDYEMRWYIMTDRSLRIREGVSRVREMTMTFANVQNLRIEQGPIQRLLGISDLRVRTAGGGSGEGESEGDSDGGESLHVGYLRGVDNAEQIRDDILQRLRLLKDSGLGDPDDGVAGESPLEGPDADAGATVLTAVRDVLAEARELRRSLTPPES